MKKRRMFWTACFFTALLVSMSSIAASQIEIEQTRFVTEKSKLSFSSSKCGDFYVSELGMNPDRTRTAQAFVEEQPLGTAHSPIMTSKSKAPDYYRRSKFFLELSVEDSKSIREFRSALDHYFFKELSRRAIDKLSQEISRLGSFQPMEPPDAVMAAIQPLLDHKSKHPRRNSLALLSLFPDLRHEIHSHRSDPLGPLLCRIEYRQHKVKLFKKWSNILIVPAVGLGIATIATASAGLILPPLAIAAGVCACALGFRDLGLSIDSLPEKERAGAVAKQMMKAYKCLETKHKLATQSGEIWGFNKSEQKRYLRNKELMLGSFARRRIELGNTLRDRDLNRLLFVAGILNIGFNSFNLTGDPRILASLVGDIAGF